MIQPLAQRRATLTDPAKDDAIALCSLSHLIGGSGHAPDIGVKMGGIQGEALAIMAGWGANIRAQWVQASPCKPEETPLVQGLSPRMLTSFPRCREESQKNGPT